ncbi:MAG: deoxyribodipyrimidine photo-lyase [Dehalococcoidales bacterium]|nr:MAG: deoxyribodipyrimidine photo-lyase [Dehalococcoidales bacterium]
MIDETRIKPLNRKHLTEGKYVLYWMQASQRVEYNHALAFAIEQSNQRKLPLIVYFGLTDGFPEANERHYFFMIEGLKEVQQAFHSRGIGCVIEQISPEIGAVKFAKNASLVVCDRGYLKIQKQWRKYVAEHIDCPLLQVESDVVVPIERASNKEEYSAATLRRKILRMLYKYLVPLSEETPKIDSSRLEFESHGISDTTRTVSALNIDHSVKPVASFHGGTSEAKKRLEEFISKKLDRYGDLRNDPNEDGLSNMSPYLHFGQISPLEIALEVIKSGSGVKDAYLEELIVRRELSINYVYYNQKYESFEGIPAWAKKTLLEHKNDNRAYIYSLQDLENAVTHDYYWNAAQKEMLNTGKMHGYMRMYWGKKILEWSTEPEKAYQTALYLNNKYELDGRDPNGFAGVAWCFGKHDRPWATRPIFGNVRFMSSEGLRRKFDADLYATRHSQ